MNDDDDHPRDDDDEDDDDNDDLGNAAADGMLEDEEQEDEIMDNDIENDDNEEEADWDGDDEEANWNALDVDDFDREFDDDDDDDYKEQMKETHSSIQAVAQSLPLEPCRQLSFFLRDDIFAGQIDLALTSQNATQQPQYIIPNMILFHLKRRLTERGAQAVCHGLKNVQMKQLTIEELRTSTTSDAFRLITLGAIPRVEELTLHARLTDIDAYQIGTQLMNENSKNLKTLRIGFGLSVGEVGAAQLARGLEQSGIETLQLRGFVSQPPEPNTSHVMQIMFLKAIPKLRELELRYPLNNEDVRLMGEALVGNEHLSLLRIRCHHSVTPHSAAILAHGLRHTQLESLELDGESEDDLINPEVEEVLYQQGVQHLTTLRHLTVFCHMRATSSLASCVSRLCTLEVLPLQSTSNEAWMRGLRSASQLTVFRCNTMLQPREVILLSEALPFLVFLTKLTVGANLTCEAGAALITESKALGRPVDFDNVSTRGVKGTGAQRLMMAVANHPRLVDLEFDDCQDVGFVALEAIGRHIPNVKLERLDVTRLDELYHFEKYGEHQAKQVHQKACQAFAAGVRSNCHLREVAFALLGLPVKVEQEISFYLALNKAGRYLLTLDHGQVPPGLWCHVFARHRDDASFIYGLMREQPTLLEGAVFGVRS